MCLWCLILIAWKQKASMSRKIKIAKSRFFFFFCSWVLCLRHQPEEYVFHLAFFLFFFLKWANVLLVFYSDRAAGLTAMDRQHFSSRTRNKFCIPRFWKRSCKSVKQAFPSFWSRTWLRNKTVFFKRLKPIIYSRVSRISWWDKSENEAHCVQLKKQK